MDGFAVLRVFMNLVEKRINEYLNLLEKCYNSKMVDYSLQEKMKSLAKLMTQEDIDKANILFREKHKNDDQWID